MTGFLLGLANGAACLAFCAPVLVPFLLGQGQSVRRNSATLLQFLGGRLGGYVLFGLLAWATGHLLVRYTAPQALMIGVAYTGLSVLLLVSALGRREPKESGCALKGARSRLDHWPALLPVGMGLLAGLKVCPPLLLAFADAASAETLIGSVGTFIAFYLGTSLYFLPLVSVGALRHVSSLRTIGRYAAVIVALYYLYSGLILLAGGISQL